MNPFKLLIDALRAICFFLDKIVYFFIPLFYKLLLYLARVDLVSGNIPVQALIQRIYILVGVFMLFRLSFSIMNYIVNPDAFSDQAKGFTNLVKRVLIAIVLLVSVPFIFAKAYEYQGKILTSGILPRLVLGEANSYENGSGTDQLEKSIDTSAKDVQFLVFGPFFSLNYHSSDLADCDPAQTGESTSHILGTTGMARSDSCLTTVAEFFDTDKEIKSSGTLLSDFFRISSDGKELEDDSRDFSSFGNLVSWSLSDGKYAINYNPIISTICGGYLAFLLLSFCIDVAARVIRLLFLQILSPVAIISSIDPTTSGDRLKEWAKECLKVWLSLFIRLLIIFIIIQLVRVITDTIYNGEYELEGGGIVPWIFIFLVLGVFQAAKNIPEYIEKATGIKMSGELQLNPFKNAWVAGATGLGLAGASMLGANAIAAGKKIGGYFASDETQSYFRNLGNLSKSRNELKSSEIMNDLRYSNLKRAFANEASALSAHGKHSTAYSDAVSARKRAQSLYQESSKKFSDDIKAVEANRDAFQASKEALAQKRKSEKWISQGASAIAGIATGAVSGAVRGAQGAYGKNLSGAISAANAARRQATDAREDRDVRADIGLSLRDRLRDSIDRWAGVRSDKNYGVGRLDDEIKGLRNEFNRIQSQMRAAAENLDAAQRGVSGVLSNNSVSNDIKNSINGLISATSTEARDSISKQLNGLLSTSAISDTDRAAITNLIDSVSHADALLGQSIDIQKAISKRENASNVGPGHGGGSGKP